MKLSTKWYVADFETTSHQYYIENGYTKVWLYAICDENAEMYSYGEDIRDFLTDIRKLYGKTIYFHNLKFDGEFIISYLLMTGWEYSDELKDIKRGFSVLIGEMGEFYGIDIKFAEHQIVHIHDSLKLLPFKVSKIAKDFNLPIEKEVIDYENYDVTPEKISYITNDVRIVALALKQIKANGMTKMTTASCAYNYYKSLKSNEFMTEFFPILEDSFLDEWREAYRGGRSQVNPYYQNKILKNVKRFDINSMYPSVMYREYLPYGNPIKIEKMNEARFELYHLYIEFSLKKGHLPTLLKKSGLYVLDDSYYVETDGVEELWISSIDYELLLRHYDVKYMEIIDMYGFRTSRLMFVDYIATWYSKKNEDIGASKIVDKLMLNCLYGKFGSNHKGYHKIPYLNEVSVVKYKKSEVQDMKHYYLPLAIAITSYAHKYIDDAIMETGIENFVYCDTDSIHTLGTLPKRLIDNKMLGKFKLEAIEEKSKYVRQKTYVTKEEGKIHITCAGMTDDMKEKVIELYGENIFLAFMKGFKVEGKFLPKHVPGGIVLYETTFQIN